MNRIATIFLAVTASLFFVGCYNDFDTPAPAKVWTDADFSDSKIISIKELKDIFEEAYPGTSGIGQSLTITDDLVIRGKVISSDQAGNVYKSMYLYDESCQSAIEIKVTSGYYITYAPNGWQVLEPMARLEEDLARPEVRDADIIIVLSHLGVRYDEQIAETYPQVNLVIGSHTHHLFEEGRLVNETYLAAADRYGYYLGCIDLTVENGQLIECQVEAIPTKSYILDLDKEDEAFIKAMREEGHRRLAQKKVANLGRELDFDETCQLVLQAVCQETHSQLTLLNTGLIMKTLGPQVTMADLQEALPHQMRMARLVVTGQELKEICQEVFTKAELLKNQAIKGMGFRGKTFGEVITGNFAYKNGNLLYNRRVVDSNEKFSLVLVDQYYFASYFPTVKEKEVTLLFPDLLRGLVAKYLGKNGANWDKI